MTVRDIQKMLGFVPQPNLPATRLTFAGIKFVACAPHFLYF